MTMGKYRTACVETYIVNNKMIPVRFYRYGHFLPDEEFPILDMKQPSSDKNGSWKFESIKVQVAYGKKCMVCGKLLKAGNAISAHDPNRNGEILLPRQTNFLPPRYDTVNKNRLGMFAVFHCK